MTKHKILKIFGLLLVAGLLFAALPTGQAQAADIPVACTGSGDTALLQAAIDGASDGDNILVSGTCVLDSGITVGKAVTLDGGGSAKIQVSGTGYRITMNTAGATLKGFDIEKTDKTGVQDIIYIAANNVTISNNKIHGQFVIGDGDVSRAMITSGGYSGVTISNNEIYDLRQPAYISGVITGDITNNYTYRTKGWVLEEGDMTFTGNTWGTGANANVYDIAILSSVSSSYYTDVPAMSAANNNAFIEDQRTSPALLTPVYVDASAPACTSDCGTARAPYNKIQDGIDRVIPGGTVHVAAGNYSPTNNGYRHLLINKSINLIGAGRNASRVIFTEGIQNGLEINAGSGVTLGPIKIQGMGFFNTSGGETGWSADWPVRVGLTGGTFEKIEFNDVRIYRGKTRNLHFEAAATYNEIILTNVFSQNAGYVGGSIYGQTEKLTITGGMFNWHGALGPTSGHGLEIIGQNGKTIKNVSVTATQFNGNHASGLIVSGVEGAVFDGIQVKSNGTNNNADTDIGFRISSDLAPVDGVEVKNSTFQYNRTGLSVYAPAGSGYYTANNVRIEKNVFTPNTANDISLWDVDQLTGLVIKHNQFVGADYAVFGNLQLGSSRVWLDPNWFGRVEGPRHYPYTEPGSGKLAWNYFCIPWCTNPGCTETGGPVTNITQHKGYATIQAAIDDANANDTITVAAGTYAENVDVTKAVTLFGPNAGVPGNGTRAAEAVIQGKSDSWVSLHVEPDVPGVTIDGFTFDGANLTPDGYSVGVAGDSSNLKVRNNVFINHNDIAIMTSGVYWSGSAWMYDKWLTDVEIKDNLINNTTLSTSPYNFGIYFQSSLGTVSGNVVTNQRNGIQVQPYWNTPGGGVVSGNVFKTYRSGIYFNYTQNATADWSFTNNNVEGIAYPTGLTPERFNAIRVETMSLGNVDFKNNSILLGTSDATEKFQYFENNVTGGTRDATHNWWGSACGPTAFSGTAANWPWWADEAMTIEIGPMPVGDFTVTPSMPISSINASIACAQPNSTITFKGGDYGGTIIVPAGSGKLTLKLENGVQIKPNSPCFTINASNTIITTESLSGAKCVPTNGANGIDVAANLDNITIKGIQFDGTGETTGSGIYFAGAVKDIVLVDNFIHNLGGDGIKFAGDVSEIVNIQGNMFKNNAGYGINNLGANDVGAEYNSWGDVAGPKGTNGDDVSTKVIYEPFTHADLYLVSSGTPWANQVVKGQDITYTVMAHLVNVNAADFVLTYPAELTYVSDTVSSTLGTASVVHNATARTLQFIGYNTANVTGDLPLFSVTFTGATAGANKPLSFSYAATSGFGMAGYESSSNVYVNAMADSAVTIIDLPTISSPDIQGYYLTGEQREFHVTADNPSAGGNYAHVIFQFNITANAGDLSVEYWTGSAWAPLPLTCSGGVCSGYYGPSGGFPMPNPYNATSLFRVTAAKPGSYPVEIKLFDLDPDPDTVLATYANTAYVYDKPTVTVATTDQYLIVGEPGAFTVKINNPTTGRNYDDSVVFDILIPSHVVSDFSALSCSITTPVPFTWNLLPLLVSDGAGGVKARIAGLDGYFEVPPTGVDIVLNCSVTVTTPGVYSASGNMIDVVDKVTPVERIVSDSVSMSTNAYSKPVITADFPAGPYAAGVPVTLPVSITNPDGIPAPFELVFDLPAGTVINYGGTDYICGATCPPIPVTLPLTSEDFVITFTEAWTGTVGISLYDSDWTPADRLLADLTQPGVVVNGNFDITGTFSMQGNSSRAGIPVTLTWGGTLVPYAPSALTSNLVSGNFSLNVLYGGYYTITTLQPRYLNVIPSNGRGFTVTGPYDIPALILRGGNAYWRSSLTELDNIIDTSDASLVGAQYGGPGSGDSLGNHGDCNFDGIVNIQDLALVGGNWNLTSAAAYTIATP